MYLFITICVIIVIAAIIWGIIKKRAEDIETDVLDVEVETIDRVYKNIADLPQETGDYVLLIVNSKVTQGYKITIEDVDLFFDECGNLIEEDNIELLKTIEKDIIFAAYIK